jgi:hypothetical protein
MLTTEEAADYPRHDLTRWHQPAITQCAELLSHGLLRCEAREDVDGKHTDLLRRWISFGRCGEASHCAPQAALAGHFYFIRTSINELMNSTFRSQLSDRAARCSLLASALGALGECLGSDHSRGQKLVAARLALVPRKFCEKFLLPLHTICRKL